MNSRILKIITTTQRYLDDPKPNLFDTLPNGSYQGLRSGFVTEAIIKNKFYRCQTKIGVKGTLVPCTVKVSNGIVSFV